MFSRIILCAAVAAMLVPSAAAKTEDVPPPALYKSYPADAEVDAQLLFLDRVSFVKDMYAMSQEEMETVLNVLQGQIPRQEQYDAARCVSLQRIRIAINLVAADETREEAAKLRLVRRFQDQINRIHAVAPLSFANVIKAAERVLPAEKVEAGRKQVLSLLASRTGMKVEKINVADIDTLLAGRVAPGDKPEVPQPPPPVDDGSRLRSRPYGPTQEERARERLGRKLNKPASPSVQRNTPSREPAESDVQPKSKADLVARRMKGKKTPEKRSPPRVIEAAPPVSEWRASYDDAVSKYGFSKEQKQAGEAIVRAVMSRAAKQQDKAAAGDADAKTDAQKRLDRLYDEMQQRINSVATIEQRQKAKGSVTEAAESASASAEKPAE